MADAAGQAAAAAQAIVAPVGAASTGPPAGTLVVGTGGISTAVNSNPAATTITYVLNQDLEDLLRSVFDVQGVPTAMKFWKH